MDDGDVDGKWPDVIDICQVHLHHSSFMDHMRLTFSFGPRIHLHLLSPRSSSARAIRTLWNLSPTTTGPRGCLRRAAQLECRVRSRCSDTRGRAARCMPRHAL